jgi:hypothetical protein
MRMVVANKKPFPDKLRLDLRVVFYQEAGFWVAHCLEMDVMGHAADKPQAMDNLLDAVVAQIAASIKVNNPANIFMPADAKFFEMFAAGTDVATAACQVEKVQSRIGEVQFDGVECREYHGAFAMA